MLSCTKYIIFKKKCQLTSSCSFKNCRNLLLITNDKIGMSDTFKCVKMESEDTHWPEWKFKIYEQLVYDS